MARLKQAMITALGILLITVYPNQGSAQLIGSSEVLEWQSPPPDHRISVSYTQQTLPTIYSV